MVDRFPHTQYLSGYPPRRLWRRSERTALTRGGDATGEAMEMEGMHWIAVVALRIGIIAEEIAHQQYSPRSFGKGH
jgi:hypothetical protein